MRTKVMVLVAAVLFLLARPAWGDEVAPALEGSDLRARADLLLRALVAAKPDPRLRGLYAAFDPSVSDAKAMAACDDDGDYVIVLSDATLRLASLVARIAKDDETSGTHKLDDYADYLVRNQVDGKRLLPPAAGTYGSGVGLDNEDRWNEIVGFLYARELAHLRAGDLVCPHPTTTRERGDDEWTAAEQTAAKATARTLYPGQQLERDESAIVELHAARIDESGALTWLQFLARFEASSAVTPARSIPSYLGHHPRSAWRAAGVRKTAAAHPKPVSL